MRKTEGLWGNKNYSLLRRSVVEEMKKRNWKVIFIYFKLSCMVWPFFPLNKDITIEKRGSV